MKVEGLLTAALVLTLCLGACSGAPSSTERDEAVREETPREVIVEDRSAADVVEGVAAPDASPAQDLSTFAGMLAARQVSSIRVLGDSITAGYLIDGFDAPSDTGIMVYNGNEGMYYETPTTVANWANAFREYAREQGVESFVNAGVSGFRMQYLAEQPDAWLGGGADVIVVMLGTNDAAKESIDDFRTYAEQALLASEAACEHLIVVSPPDNERTDAQNLYGMDQIDQVLAELSSEHGWEHVSLFDVLAVGSDDFFPDQVHPTAAGSAKLWAALSQRLGLG